MNEEDFDGDICDKDVVEYAGRPNVDEADDTLEASFKGVVGTNSSEDDKCGILDAISDEKTVLSFDVDT
jgi:hypothetical protein